MELRNQELVGVRGYAMAAMLVAIAVMAVLLSVAMPAWRQTVQREKEEELVFRGQQYVRAIGLFQRKYAASFPPDIDTLVNQKFLRRKYKDPMTSDGEFQVLYQMSLLGPGQQQGVPGQGGRGGPGNQQAQGQARGGQPGAMTGANTGANTGAFGRGGFGTGTAGPRGGVIGVASKSTDTSIRLYNGRNHYNEWQFIFAANMMPGQGMGRPGMPGGRGGRGMGPGGMNPGGRGMGPGGMNPGGRGMGPGGMNPGGFRPGGPGTGPGQPHGGSGGQGPG